MSENLLIKPFLFSSITRRCSNFLSAKGTALTYQAWYYHWNRAMIANELSLNPHKARHWFVTSRLREIYNISNSGAEIEQRKMNWLNI